MGIWEVIQKEIVDKPEISAELRTSWREQESMVLTLKKIVTDRENRSGKTKQKRKQNRKQKGDFAQKKVERKKE